MKKHKPLSSSMEDYLETIAALQKERGVARVRDISRVMNVKTPSVNAAIKTLYRYKLVDHEKYGYVELTSKGEKVAQSVQRRHDMLLKFLTEILRINPKTAEKDACKMEHSISPETSEKLIKFIEFVETCPESDGPRWLKSYGYYSETGKRPKCVIRKETKKKQTKNRKRKEKLRKE
jgi:DtxR family Mn-dependent transcriptional regulator